VTDDRSTGGDTGDSSAPFVVPEDPVAVRSSAADPAGVAALALSASGADPSLNAELRAFLTKRNEVAVDEAALLNAQRTLVERRIGRARLEEEHIAAQNRHLHLQRFHERFRLILDVVLASVGVVLLSGLVWALYGAFSDRAIIVNSFTVAPKLETQGESGTIVASMLIDQISRLRKSSRYGGAKRSVADALEDKVQVDIPEMHVSVGELRRLLHETLGHRIQIRGELLEEPTGLTLTLRGTDLPTKSFVGKADELPALVSRAAEYVYGHTDPVLMAYYLQRAGRTDDAITFIRSSYGPASIEDRAVVLNVWGNSLGSIHRLPEALEKFRAAIELKPDLWSPYYNLIIWQIGAGREEQALQAGRDFERAGNRGRWFGPHAPEDYFSELDALRGDLSRAAREMRMDYDISGGQGTSGWSIGAEIAWVYAQQHDPANTEFFLAANPDAVGIDGALIDEAALIAAAAARGRVALEMGRYPEAASDWDEWARRLAAAPASVLQYEPVFSFWSCWPPIVYELAGRRADADAALAAAEHFANTDCYLTRGDVYDHRGDFAQAERAYSVGVEHAPSLPQGYFSWGAALLRHQKYVAAIEKLAAANERGPNWADPLEAWGEALAGQGKFKEAIAKFAEAAGHAPRWGALYLHWGEALDKLGDHARAITQYQKAQALALSEIDRGTLALHLSALPR
jgi:tetratricopeptide (TPR) repeat protein